MTQPLLTALGQITHSWRFALAFQALVQLFIFSVSLMILVVRSSRFDASHPWPSHAHPHQTQTPAHHSRSPRNGSRFRISDWGPAWQPQPGTFLTPPSFQQANSTPSPHTYKPRPYPRGPTHLPQPWRCGEKQRKQLLSTRARHPPPRNPAAPEIPPRAA